MHTMFTPDLARQIVHDRLRDAEDRRLVRATRRSRGAARAVAGTGGAERAQTRTSRFAFFLGGRTADAH